MDQLIITVFYIVVVLYSIVIHEVAHGVMANSLGDPTAKHLGRLTLNPIKHLDFFGSIILPLLTFFAAGFVFGYAKPVPYNPLNLRDRVYGPAKVAMAGPATNIIIALIFGLSVRFLPLALEATVIPQLFSFIVFINLLLSIFNLMPVPPLDGHWLVLTFVPDRYYQFKQFFTRYGLILFIFFLVFIFPIIFPIITFFFELITGSSFNLFR